MSGKPFDAQRFSELRAQGVPVFIDFTAAWCITCQVNKKVALTSKVVRAKLKEHGFVLLRGDWTNEDSEVTQALRSFGQDSVPFNIIYGPDPHDSGHILPTLLTPGIIIEAIDDLEIGDN